MSEPRTAATLFRPIADDASTLTDSTRADPSSSSASSSASLAASDQVARYRVKSILGRGGMGEVRLCVDERIGREVAVKVAHPHATRGVDGQARFLREARVQGQLEHPSIVPVHDLEILDDGSAYFAMKRVRGETLSSLLAAKKQPQRKLLSALLNVCLAVDFAHSRGVVHRDLKPGNIMLGDFGEVYVLDWGLAKIITPADEPTDKNDGIRAVRDRVLRDVGATAEEPAPDLGADAHTQAGNIMGTPGYMAPEQVDPSVGPIAPATDIYALGSILFEIVTGRPLIESKDAVEVALLMLKGVDGSPIRRAPNASIPAALDAICVRALARDPEQRFASARAMHDALDRFLAGEDELEMRRAMSREHAVRANDAEKAADRARALSELGSALAFDPQNTDARRALLELLTSPPAQVPAAARARIDADNVATVRDGAASTALFTLALLPFSLVALWLGVLEWSSFFVALGGAAVLAGGSGLHSRRSRLSNAFQYVTVAIVCTAYVALGRIAGPFMLLPTVVAGLAIPMQSHPDAGQRRFALIAACASVVLAVVVDMFASSPSYTFVDGGFMVHERMLHLGSATVPFLLAGTLSALVVPSYFVRRLRVALTTAETKLHVQAWQLEQLVRPS